MYIAIKLLEGTIEDKEDKARHAYETFNSIRLATLEIEIDVLRAFLTTLKINNKQEV